MAQYLGGLPEDRNTPSATPNTEAIYRFWAVRFILKTSERFSFGFNLPGFCGLCEEADSSLLIYPVCFQRIELAELSGFCEF